MKESFLSYLEEKSKKFIFKAISLYGFNISELNPGDLVQVKNSAIPGLPITKQKKSEYNTTSIKGDPININKNEFVILVDKEIDFYRQNRFLVNNIVFSPLWRIPNSFCLYMDCLYKDKLIRFRWFAGFKDIKKFSTYLNSRLLFVKNDKYNF